MPKVLLIDDSKTIQKVASLILKGSAYTLLPAEDGKRGEELAILERPDIALVDSTIGTVDGLELIQSFRKNHKLREMKIGFLYGGFKKISDEVSEKCGIDGKLSKPFDAPEFLRFLEDLEKVRRDFQVPFLPPGVDIITDEFKSLFDEEELEKSLNFLEQPLLGTTAPKALPTPPSFDDQAPLQKAQIPESTIEKICREMIPPLAEKIIREELQKLLNEKND